MEEKEILNFIRRRLGSFRVHDNSYWFAHVLCARFPSLEMFYLPEAKCFVAGNIEKNEFYDASGLTTLEEEPCSFKKLLYEDPKKYFNLLKIYRD